MQQEEEKKDAQALPQEDISKVAQQCKDLMRLAKEMPECFEKTLVRTIYMSSLLSRTNSIDDVLYIETNDLRLAQFQTDLNKLQDLMEKEKLDDNYIDLIIRETVAYFRTNNHSLRKYEQWLMKLLELLKTKIRSFNFQEFFELVAVCETNSERIKD